MKKWPFVASALLLAAVAGGMIFVQMLDQPSHEEQGTDEVLIGGPFALVDQTGRNVTEADYAGRFKLIYFGYTYCPDICPTGLAQMSAAYDLLTGEQQEKTALMFITVDPERDTVEAMADYVSLFHPALQGLTGSVEAVEATRKVYRVYARKAETEDRATTDYLVDHSTFTYLMDGDNRYVTHFSHGTSAEEMAASIAGYLD